jgi:hypothetical protein
MNQCFVCGPTENKITEEHVWPFWVSELLRGKYGSDHCDKCNNNWLSAFENNDIRPLATPLILGEWVDIIKPDDQ